ncbi:MAG: flagellar hook assembly protein FlgD [Alphaproteobacteria bacterium]|nr:flagellar hook assembly protein FlgD [Alphaproteobacteria bacterium]
MSVSSINQATSSATSTTDASASLAKLSGNYTQFLKLLTAQLQNQDPLKPMDTAQFTQQLVQFAGVEQSIAVNKNLESLVALQQAGQNAQATIYLGRKVESIGDTQPLVDGKATYGYAFDGTPTNVQIFISDKNNNVVFQTTGEAGTGGHNFAWDGKDMNGLAAPDGDYTIRVSATDAAGGNVRTSTSVNLVIDAVEMHTEGAVLLSGKQVININDIIRIKSA